MNNFLFEDCIDGGFFFVQCETLEEAYDIIWEELACEHPECNHDTLALDYDYLGNYTDTQAEAMGYDTF